VSGAPPVRFVILQDHKENRRKCTAAPLQGLAGIETIRLRPPRSPESPLEVPGGIWLAVDGPPLEPEDRKLLEEDGRVLVLDSTWARLGGLERRLYVRERRQAHRRSLPAAIRSAYPRRSKLFEDPPGGLATVEAVFAVTAILGEARWEVLESYRWAEDFLARNGWLERPPASHLSPCTEE
jgi:pre-rRNA-processing protein TSR3